MMGAVISNFRLSVSRFFAGKPSLSCDLRDKHSPRMGSVLICRPTSPKSAVPDVGEVGLHCECCEAIIAVPHTASPLN